MITGAEYYRREHRLNKKEMAEQAGVEVAYLQPLLDIKRIGRVHIGRVMTVADGLAVTADELIMPRDETKLKEFTQYRVTRSVEAGNCILNYRMEKRLTLDQLGRLLGGMTREGARKVCAAPEAGAKHVLCLAAYEGITPTEFCKRYSGGNANDRL